MTPFLAASLIVCTLFALISTMAAVGNVYDHLYNQHLFESGRLPPTGYDETDLVIGGFFALALWILDFLLVRTAVRNIRSHRRRRAARGR